MLHMPGLLHRPIEQTDMSEILGIPLASGRERGTLEVAPPRSPGTASIEAAYVGSKGTHQPPAYNGYYNSNGPTLVGYLSGLSTNQRRPYFNSFGWTQFGD